MCRLAAYLGPPAPLSTLLYDPPRSLEVQSYDPREQLSGRVNVDGTGLAWWQAGEDEPLRYVSDRPAWSDPNLPHLSRRLASAAQLAVVRSATPGVPVGPAQSPPFLHGRLALAHNGYLEGFRQRSFRPLLDRLPDALHAALDAVSDTQVLLLTLVRHLEQAPQAGLVGALAATVLEAAELCSRAEACAVLNLVVGDGQRFVGSRFARGTPAPALYTLAGGERWPEGRLLASEPLDADTRWTKVPDGHVVTLTAFGATTVPLEEAAASAS